MKFLSSHRRRLVSLVAAVAVASAFGSCVEDMGMINRTGPDKIKKTDLEGLWIYVGTVTDAPYSTALVFTGLTNAGEYAKVVFDIQEDFLIAYPVIEYVEGTEKEWKLQPIRKYWDPKHRDEFQPMYVGPPLMRWPIESHFDVVRNYNTYNGAQSNELGENTTDRDWFQRDYIRVDWAGQKVGAFFFDVAQSTGMSAYLVSESHAEEPDAMTLDPEGGYFDYTIRQIVASSGNYPELGTMGTSYCSIYGLSKYDCAQAEVKVRHSFKRLDPKRDYQPIRYHNNEHQELFGYFLTERYAYDSDWGSTYEGKVSFANRWNLWLDNFDYEYRLDENGEKVSCFADVECNIEAGERCQKDAKWFETGACAVPKPRPYTQRRMKPIVYHVNADWHPDYLKDAYYTADGWNDAFQDAAAWRLFYEELNLARTRTCETHSDCTTITDPQSDQEVSLVLFDRELTVRDPGQTCHEPADCGVDSCADYDDGDGGTERRCRVSGADCATDLDCNNPTCVSGSCAIGGADCTSDLDCEMPACGAGGLCVQKRRCSTGDPTNGVAPVPCALGQTCTGGVCMADGQPVDKLSAANGAHGSTVVYYGAGNPVVTHDNFNKHLLTPFKVNGGQAYVRFVHAAPDAGAVSLTMSKDGQPTQTISGGTFDAARDYDPQDPATAPFMKLVPSMQGVAFRATQGGAVLAETYADIVPGNSYMVVFNGTDLLLEGTPFNDASYGIRLIHAAVGAPDIDFGVEGVRVDKAVAYKTATPYRAITGEQQRVTLTYAGDRGDITCHVEDTIGRCVGWGPELSQADYNRVDTIKAGLPPLVVVCENQFNPTLAIEDTGRVAAARACLGVDRLDSGACESADVLNDARYTVQLEGGETYNPCGDPELVAEPEEIKKIGDIRYNQMYWIDEMMRAGPLGYGPSAADPHTGEIVYGVAYIYGGYMHTYAQYAADLVDMINGDLEVSDLITGEFIREFVAAKQDSNDPEVASYFGALSASDRAAMEPDTTKHVDHVASVAPMAPQASTQINRAQLPKHDYQFPELMEYQRNPARLKMDLEYMLPTMDPQLLQNRLNKVGGTWIEDLMVNNEILAAGKHVDPEGKLSPTDLRTKLSPLNWAPKVAIQAERERVAMLARENIYMAEFVDDALFGIAKELKNAGYTGKALRDEVGRRILRGVLEHEFGHNIGLRHNFSGSTDVFNFHDEYYSIREREYIFCQADDWCDDVVGEGCAFQTCDDENPCPAGLLCWPDEDEVYRCMAPEGFTSSDLIATGVCAMEQADKQCATDDDCTDNGICDENGKCFTAKQQFVPRSWMTDNERAQKRTEYQYTTLMDYGGKFNSDIHGLGKYDYAAIRFAYGELRDVYADDSKIRQRVLAAAKSGGNSPAYYSFFLNSLWWPSRGTGFWHSFNYLENYIGVEENLKRTPMPYELLKYSNEMVINDVREYIDKPHIEVPYAFCSDEYRGNMGCYLFDQGIDMGEMASNAMLQLTQYYVFDAFKRERLWFGEYGNPLSYYSRIMSRYFTVLGDVGMYTALWDSFLFRYSWYESWKQMPLGGYAMDRAARDTFGDLKDVVASPSPGCYMKDDSDETRPVYRHADLKANDECDLSVQFGVGRFPYTQYGTQLGYTFYEHPLWFGSFWEKLGALITLTDSTAYFADTYVGEQLNIGVGTSLGFNTVYANEMNNFLGGIIADELDFYAGREVQGAYVAPSVPGRTETDIPVEPSLNAFTLKLYAAVFGLAYLPAGFDPQFIDRLAIFVEGESSHFTHLNQPGIVEHRFEDPIGGKTYLAYSTNYGYFGEAKIEAGAATIDRAQELADRYVEAHGEERAELEQQLRRVREVLDILRTLHHIYGTSTLGL